MGKQKQGRPKKTIEKKGTKYSISFRLPMLYVEMFNVAIKKAGVTKARYIENVIVDRFNNE